MCVSVAVVAKGQRERLQPYTDPYVQQDVGRLAPRTLLTDVLAPTWLEQLPAARHMAQGCRYIELSKRDRLAVQPKPKATSERSSTYTVSGVQNYARWF